MDAARQVVDLPRISVAKPVRTNRAGYNHAWASIWKRHGRRRRLR